MSLLGAVAYDPATAANNSTAALLAMTAIDTTNCRITFTAPANGSVFVRIRAVTKGSNNSPMILLGVLDGATVRGRQSPISPRVSGAASQFQIREASFVVTGLTPGNSYTWDAAYAVQVLRASTSITYGGPDNTNNNDATGAFVFEIWETTNLLASTLYDPSVAVAKDTTASLAMTALDTTNLRLTFTAPASGRVLVRMHAGAGWGATGTTPTVQLGILDGATVRARVSSLAPQTQIGTAVATDHFPIYASFPVLGLTPGASYTWDAAYGVETVLAGSSFSYGGPNDNVGANAWGGFAYEIWSA